MTTINPQYYKSKDEFDTNLPRLVKMKRKDNRILVFLLLWCDQGLKLLEIYFQKKAKRKEKKEEGERKNHIIGGHFVCLADCLPLS